MNDPNYIAQNIHPAVKERAQRLQTWKQVRRDAQYEGPAREQPAELLRGVNAANNKARAIEKTWFRNALIVALVTSIVTSLTTLLAALAAHLLR